MIVSYNDSQFRLMFAYRWLFEKLWKEEVEQEISALKDEKLAIEEFVDANP